MTVRIGVVGIPLGTVFPKDRTIQTEQVAAACKAVRPHLVSALGQIAEVSDYGDVTLSYDQDPPSMKELAQVFDATTQALSDIWKKDSFLVVQGGGCGIASGTFAAFAKHFPQGHVLWFDGHADFSTQKTTLSHYLGGLALATAVGAADLPAAIPAAQVTLLSGRGADWNEISLMNEYGLRHVYPEQIETWLANNLPETDLYVHFDVDVLEQGVMPAVDLPVFPGISLSLAEQSLQRIAASGRLRGIEFTAYNPTLDPQSIGHKTIIHLATLTASAIKTASTLQPQAVN
ncbi:MAG: arginase family protein [Firmicutes bacterium]|nr:arginase family protein [Bacillota bacterium]